MIDPFNSVVPESQNPFELQQPAWGGMPQIESQTGQFGGLPQDAGGSYFQLSPEAMQMMWAPKQVQPQPQTNPLLP